MAQVRLYGLCVSTIVERRRLEDFALKGRGKFEEKRAWKTAQHLFDQATSEDQKVPVILSDAAFNRK